MEIRVVRRPTPSRFRSVAAAVLLAAALASAVFSGAHISFEPGSGYLAAGLFLFLALGVRWPAVLGALAALAAAGVAVGAVTLLFVGAVRASLAGTFVLLVLLHIRPLLRSLQLRASRAREDGDTAPLKMRRVQPSQIVAYYAEAILVAAILACAHDFPGRKNEGWTARDVGLPDPLVATIALGLGAAVSFPFQSLRGAVGRLPLQSERASLRADMAVLGQNLPRGPIWQLLVMLETVFLSPVLEELVYRGFFVYALAATVGSDWCAIVVGLGLFLCLHAYQGLHLLGSHLAFFAVVIALLYSPLGLAGAIGFHVACNLRYALHIRGLARHYVHEARTMNRQREACLASSTGAVLLPESYVR